MTQPEIFLLRHGQTTWNRVHRHQGHLDAPLTALGVEQARAMGRRLAAEIEDWSEVAIQSSPLFRCQQTAAIALDEAGADIETMTLDARLMERSYGRWQGLTDDEIADRFPEDLRGRREQRWDYTIPGGAENYPTLRIRIAAWLADQQGAERMVVISHGVSGRMIRGLYQGLPPEDIMTMQEPQDGLVHLKDGTSRFLEGIGDGGQAAE